MKERIVLVILFLVFFISLVGVAEGSSSSFGKVERLFLEGKYESAVSEAERLITARSSNEDEIVYLKALSELKLNRFDDARKDFSYIISRFQSSRRIFDSYLGIADSSFLESKTESAIKEYNEVVDKFPNDRNIAVVYYRLADAYKKIGVSDKALFYSEKARKASPLSFEYKAAPYNGAVSGPTPGEIKEMPPVPKPKELSRTAGIKGFSVQVGSFKSKRNADKLAQKLMGRGYDSFVELPVGSGDKLYRVKVSRGKSKEEAEIWASRLKRDGYFVKICSEEICE